MSDKEFNLSFTMTPSQSNITFLDVEVKVGPDGLLQSDLFRKPSAGNSILHFNSAHPRSLVRSIPFGQYLCLMRIQYVHARKILYDKPRNLGKDC